MGSKTRKLVLQADDALVVVDVQNDFLPGGALAVRDGDQVISPLNGYIELFERARRPIFATRDWHPPNHCSFKEFGGRWPPHCIAESHGAEFSSSLNLPSDATVISKGTKASREAYSGFQDTALRELLKTARIHRFFVGGLATDYCVLHTVDDALEYKFQVFLLEDAIKGVNVDPRDSAKALHEMEAAGATRIHLNDIAR